MHIIKSRALHGFVAALLAAGVAGCASSGSNSAAASSGGPTTSIAGKASSRDKVSLEEITAAPGSTAYDLVYHLRPDWLRQRGAASMVGGSQGGGGVLVYLDGVKMGGLDALRSINARGIQGIEWIPGSKAAMVLSDVGSSAIVGAITIRTR